MRSLSDTDRNFIQQARPMNIAEINLGELAREYASRPELQRLGEKLVQDHAQTNYELMQLIRGTDVEVPDRMDRDHQKIEQRLLELEGDEFDKTFVRAQLDDHHEMVSLFQDEADHGEDPGLKAFAQGRVPMLQQHLQSIQRAASSLRA